MQSCMPCNQPEAAWQCECLNLQGREEGLSRMTKASVAEPVCIYPFI